MNGKNQIRRAYEAIFNNDFEDAIRWFNRAIQLEPDNAAYHYKISITYARSDKLDKALFHAAKASHLMPEQHEYRYHFQRLRARQLSVRAKELLEEDNPQLHMVLIYLQDAVRLDPLFEEAWILKAITHAKLEDFDQAVQNVKKAVELNPDNDMAAKLLETYKIKLKQYFHK